MPLKRSVIASIITQKSISLDDAKEIIEAAKTKAKQIKPMCIAVVDVTGNLIAFERMDGAWYGSIDVAINKAYTARAFDTSTKELGVNAQPGKQFYGIQNMNRVAIFAGGVPLKFGSSVVGAIGVSGGSGDQDEEVAQAGAHALSLFGKNNANKQQHQ